MIRLLLLAAALAGCAGPMTAEKVLDAAALQGAAPVDLAPGAGCAPLVRTVDNLYHTRAERFLLKPGIIVEAACASDDGPVYLRGGKLRAGDLELEVPLRDVRLAAAGRRIYLAGVEPLGQAVLHLIEPGQGHQPLLRLPAPIGALATAGKDLYFSCGPAVFRFRPGGKLSAEAALPGFDSIPYLAVDAEQEILYFSDGEALYALAPRKGRIVLLFARDGGPLAFRGGCLYLLSLRRRALYRLRRVSAALAAGKPPLVGLE